MSTCPNCGHPNPPATERCRNCNAWITQEEATASQQPRDANLEERVRSLLNQGRKIEAIKVYREATGAGLAEAKEAVEAIEKGQSTPTGNLEKELLSLLQQGNKIEAIKLYREETGAGLKEAKDAVEVLARQHNIRGTGCRGLLALFLVAGSLLQALVVVLSGKAEEPAPNRDEVIAAMRPYDGPSIEGVDSSTLTGKIMCGYQGWFTAPGDASGRGWRHYPARGHFKPGFCGIDLWPDVSELEEDEKYPTPFRHKDGRVAAVFSSHNRKTVLRHFRWLQEYGIDGVFVQRFGIETISPKDLRHCNTVLAHCREGANRCGRCYAIMYDLSGLPKGGAQQVIEDWKLLVDRMRIGKDPKDIAYVRHNGKPVVAVWGIGFNDGRKYTLEECQRLVDFLKNDQKYGGFTVSDRCPLTSDLCLLTSAF